MPKGKILMGAKLPGKPGEGRGRKMPLPVKPAPKGGKNPKLPYRIKPTEGPRKKQPIGPRPKGGIIDPGFVPKNFGPKKKQPVRPAPKGNGIRDLLYRVKPGELKAKKAEFITSYLTRKRGVEQTRGESTKAGSANTKTPNKYNNYRTPQMSATAMPKPKRMGIFEAGPKPKLKKAKPASKRVPSMMNRMRP